MNTIITKIEQILTQVFEPSHLIILDESQGHSIYDGSTSHVAIIITSSQFQEQSLIKRHQQIYKALGDVTKVLHAIRIIALTPNEHEKTPEISKAPRCRGGGHA